MFLFLDFSRIECEINMYIMWIWAWSKIREGSSLFLIIGHTFVCMMLFAKPMSHRPGGGFPSSQLHVFSIYSPPDRRRRSGNILKTFFFHDSDLLSLDFLVHTYMNKPAKFLSTKTLFFLRADETHAWPTIMMWCSIRKDKNCTVEVADGTYIAWGWRLAKLCIIGVF